MVLVEYGSVVWDPHTSKEKDKVERVNGRAAGMVSNDYGRHSSVTSMLTRLGWATLEQRRQNQRLTMMYKVDHGLVAVGKGIGQRQRHITLVERLKSHIATSEALVMSRAKLA